MRMHMHLKPYACMRRPPLKFDCKKVHGWSHVEYVENEDICKLSVVM